MMIDTFQISCFLSVAEHLNFTLGANDMFITQPAISRKVAALEKELDVILIDRTSRELKLTQDGLIYQEFFLNFMRQLGELSAKTRKCALENVEEINIGIFEGWNLSAFLRTLQNEFKVKHGNAILNIDTCSEKSLLQGLKDGKYDVIILLKISIKTAINAGYVNHVDAYDVSRVRKCAFYSVHNPLAEKEDLKFEDFRNQVLYTFKSGIVPDYVITNMDLLKKNNFEPKIKILSTLDAVINAVSTGSGYALFDNISRISENRDFKCLTLEETHAISAVSLNQNRRECVDWLMNYCRDRGLGNI